MHNNAQSPPNYVQLTLFDVAPYTIAVDSGLQPDEPRSGDETIGGR